MPTIPATSSNPSTASAAPMPGSIFLVERAVAGNGIDSSPGPFAPRTANRICHDPVRMIHKCPVYVWASPAAGVIASGSRWMF